MSELLQQLAKSDLDKKIVLLVFDGLGGLSQGKGTELEVARTPVLDRLAREGVCGLLEPVAPGITPGSGPAHLALFGYDPIVFDIGRGVLSALGVGFDIEPGDVPCRVNFCALDKDGTIIDRRAYRPPDDVGGALAKILAGIEVGGVKTFAVHEKEHRAAVVFRGRGLCGAVADTDPQATGVPPLPARAKDAGNAAAVATAKKIEQFADAAKAAMAQAGRDDPAVSSYIAAKKKDHPGLFQVSVLLRGFDEYKPLPLMQERYAVTPCAVAVYPMYRGVSKLVGMNVVDAGKTFADQMDALEKHWAAHDFFFVHVKYTDSRGEDGDFEAKVKVLEDVDPLIERIVALKPACLAVTGDHSTPAKMKTHSFHPVPVLVHSDLARTDACQKFGEAECLKGALGPALPMKHLMALLLAHAGRLDKYGA